MPKTCRELILRHSLPIALTLIFSSLVSAQIQLPIENKPRTRNQNEKIVFRTVPMQPTKGVLAVVLDPIVSGKITIKDAAGKVIANADADAATGQAEFTLPRKKIYQVEAAFPGFSSASGKSKVLAATASVRLNLKPQFAALELLDVPPTAQIYLDNQLREYKEQALFSDLTPGEHALLIKHPEYNDYTYRLSLSKAGARYDLSVRLTKVAKLTLQSQPSAMVYIDGALQGRVNADGQVNLDYELPQAGEHVVSIELPGYETWSQKIMLAPGPRTIAANLTPIVTSAGMSDSFDSLSLWSHPATWKLIKDGANSKLQVSGDALGLLKNKLYRNFEVHFTVWLADGKGATWAVRADKEGKRYYLFHLTGAAPAEGLASRRFYTYLMQDGGLSEVNSPVTVLTKLNNKDSYTIHLTVKENVITHDMTSNVDGEQNELGVYTDTTTTKERSLYGTFGFLSFKGESFQVDDFNLQPLLP